MLKIQNTFFDESIPLVPKPKSKSCCIIIPDHFQTRVSRLKKMALSVALLSGVLITYVTYESTKSLIEYPIADPKSIISLALLGVEGLGATVAACSYVALRRFRNNFLNQFPHRDYYVGSFWTPYYYFLQQNDLNDKNTCSAVIQTFITDIKKHALWEKWCEIKKIKDEKSAEAYLLAQLKQGLCYGNSMELLSLMPKLSTAPSAELIQKLNFEKKLYFQALHTLITDLVNDEKKEGIYWILETFLKNSSEEEIEKELSSSPYRSRNYLFLRSIGLDKQDFLFHELELQNLKNCSKNDLKIYFEKGISELKKINNIAYNEDMEITGCIHLYGVINGHALFFQLSQTFYRFHDSGYPLTGFFEFPTKELFFQYLHEHILTWPNFKDGEYKISLTSFQKPKQDLPVVLIE